MGVLGSRAGCLATAGCSGSQVADGPLELPQSTKASYVSKTKGLSAAQYFKKDLTLRRGSS